MTEEKVERANQLLKWIEELKDQKSRWENAKSIYRLEVISRDNEYRNRAIKEVNTRWVNFKELKLLAIARISERLEELQREFDNL